MARNDYHFISHWRVKSSVQEVSDILSNAPDLVRWWPAVYLAVEELEAGEEGGVGKVVSLLTKGWLPYTLRWKFKVVESRAPYGSTIKALGDLDGRGIWTFEQDGDYVNISYDWKIEATKPLLRHLSFMLRPLFAKNHEWAMAKGEESLKLELARLSAKTNEERAAVAAPPEATPSSFLAWLRYLMQS